MYARVAGGAKTPQQNRPEGIAHRTPDRTGPRHNTLRTRMARPSISLSYNPKPSSPLGFNARVSPAWGGESMNGAEAL